MASAFAVRLSPSVARAARASSALILTGSVSHRISEVSISVLSAVMSLLPMLYASPYLIAAMLFFAGSNSSRELILRVGRDDQRRAHVVHERHRTDHAVVGIAPALAEMVVANNGDALPGGKLPNRLQHRPNVRVLM